MDDQINRQKLIEELDNLSLSVELWTSMKPSEIVKVTIEAYRHSVMEAINSQPPADKWIPCSERLPEKSGYYEITVELSDMEERYTETEFYSGYEKSWCSKLNIIAWREHLPEPYKGVE